MGLKKLLSGLIRKIDKKMSIIENKCKKWYEKKYLQNISLGLKINLLIGDKLLFDVNSLYSFQF